MSIEKAKELDKEMGLLEEDITMIKSNLMHCEEVLADLKQKHAEELEKED